MKIRNVMLSLAIIPSLLLAGCGKDDNNTNKRIYVYDDSGKFKYGYTFKSYGTFGVDLDKNDNLIIYFCRSNIMAVFDENGNCLDMREILNKIENNKYWNQLYPTVIELNGNVYQLKNDMGIFNCIATNYSQLIKKDQVGNITIIYNANESQLFKIVTESAMTLVFLTLVICVVIREVKKYREKNSSQ